jgi:hypothetical protein
MPTKEETEALVEHLEAVLVRMSQKMNLGTEQ